MGIAVSKVVWANSRSKGATRLVMLCLAEHTNNKGLCWPSISTIAKETKVSDRQVSRAIQELVELKEIVIMEKGDGRGKSTLYRIILKDDTMSSFEPEEKGDILSQKGDISSIKDDTMSTKDDMVSSKPLYNHKETLIEPLSPPTPLTGEYGRIEAAVCTATKKQPMLLEEVEKKQIDRLFKSGYTADEVSKLYDQGGWWFTQYWKGKKGQRPKLSDIVDTIGEAVESIRGSPNGHVPRRITVLDDEGRPLKEVMV